MAKARVCYTCKHLFKRNPCNICRAKKSVHYWEDRNILDELRVMLEKIRRNLFESIR